MKHNYPFSNYIHFFYIKREFLILCLVWFNNVMKRTPDSETFCFNYEHIKAIPVSTQQMQNKYSFTHSLKAMERYEKYRQVSSTQKRTSLPTHREQDWATQLTVDVEDGGTNSQIRILPLPSANGLFGRWMRVGATSCHYSRNCPCR